MTSIVFLLLFVVTVNASCSWPCKWLGRTWYSDLFNLDFRLEDSATLVISAPPGSPSFEIRLDCVERSGPFIVNRRNGSQYQCIQVITLCDDAFLLKSTQLFERDTPPAVCEICSPETLTDRQTWFAKDLTRPFKTCNVPKDCPVNGPLENACDGTETKNYVVDDKPDKRRHKYAHKHGRRRNQQKRASRRYQQKRASKRDQ